MIITERIYNAETGQTEDIEREATPEEVAKYEADLAEAAALEAEYQAKEAARIAAEQKLEVLGLTADDLRALGL